MSSVLPDTLRWAGDSGDLPAFLWIYRCFLPDIVSQGPETGVWAHFVDQPMLFPKCPYRNIRYKDKRTRSN